MSINVRSNGHAAEGLSEPSSILDISDDPVGEETADMTPRGTTNTTAVPNWLMPIIIFVFISLIGFVYTTLNNSINDMKNQLSTEQLKQQNTREQLISHGWYVDDQGGIHAPTAPAAKTR
jgi:hypothetical protein